jgi:hypothetical protein
MTRSSIMLNSKGRLLPTIAKVARLEELSRRPGRAAGNQLLSPLAYLFGNELALQKEVRAGTNGSTAKTQPKRKFYLEKPPECYVLV